MIPGHEKPLDAAHCALCARYHSDSRYRELVDGYLNRPTKKACIHLGQPTGKSVECPTCCGVVKLKLSACTVHGSCTAAKRVDGHGCCDAKCEEYAPTKTSIQ